MNESLLTRMSSLEHCSSAANRNTFSILASDGQVDLAVSEAILAESLRVLKDKFDRAPEWLAEADRQLRVIARIVEPTEHLQVIESDPTDDRILECAVAAAA